MFSIDYFNSIVVSISFFNTSIQTQKRDERGERDSTSPSYIFSSLEKHGAKFVKQDGDQWMELVKQVSLKHVLRALDNLDGSGTVKRFTAVEDDARYYHQEANAYQDSVIAYISSNHEQVANEIQRFVSEASMTSGECDKLTEIANELYQRSVKTVDAVYAWMAMENSQEFNYSKEVIT